MSEPLPTDENGIITTNDFLVGRSGELLTIPMLGIQAIDRFTAMRFAAWIVVLADEDDQFSEVLKAVQNT